MAETRPRSGQLRFILNKSDGTAVEHNLDTYLEDAAIGDKTLKELFEQVFATDGTFDVAFSLNTSGSTNNLEYTFGSGSATVVTPFFNIRGNFLNTDTYANFDIITAADADHSGDLYIVHSLSGTTTFADEATMRSSANTTKIIDTQRARDWAIKTSGPVEGSVAGGDAEYSAKFWATSSNITTIINNLTDIGTVVTNMSDINDVADALDAGQFGTSMPLTGGTFTGRVTIDNNAATTDILFKDGSEAIFGDDADYLIDYDTTTQSLAFQRMAGTTSGALGSGGFLFGGTPSTNMTDAYFQIKNDEIKSFKDIDLIGGELRNSLSDLTINPNSNAGTNAGTVIIKGNLQVDGTTTTINSTTVSIDDINFVIAADAADSAASDGAGINIAPSGANVSFTFDNANTRMNLNTNMQVAGTLLTTGNVNGRNMTNDGNKLDGITAGAQPTDATTVSAAGAAMLGTAQDFTEVQTFEKGINIDSTEHLSFGSGTTLSLSGNQSINTFTFDCGGNPRVQIDDNGILLTSNAVHGLKFEGASTDANQTSVRVVDPTADRVINFPDADGTVITTGNLADITSLGNLSSTSLIFEGATDDAFETTLTVVDPTADRTVTIPDRTGTMLLSDLGSQQTINFQTQLTFLDDVDSSTNSSRFFIKSNNDGTSGVQLNLWKNSSSPAVNDRVGVIKFLGTDSAGQNLQAPYAQLSARIDGFDLSQSRHGHLNVEIQVAGSNPVGGSSGIFVPASFHYDRTKIETGKLQLGADNTSTTFTTSASADRTVNFPDVGGTALVVASDGTNGQLLSTDGSGTFSFTAPYSLPIAAAGTLGGIKVGSNLTINAATGVLDADQQAPLAGLGIDVAADKTVSVDLTELTSSTTNADANQLIGLNSANDAQVRIARSNINLSGFNNDLPNATTTDSGLMSNTDKGILNVLNGLYNSSNGTQFHEYTGVNSSQSTTVELQIGAEGLTFFTPNIARSLIYSDAVKISNVTYADLVLQAGRNVVINGQDNEMSGNLSLDGNLHIEEDHTISFEGATNNAFETTLSVVDPTADNTLFLPDSDGRLIANDNGTVDITSTSNQFFTSKPILVLNKVNTSSTTPSNENLGGMEMYGINDADEKTLYAAQYGASVDLTDGAEDGELAFWVKDSGTLRQVVEFKKDKVQFNRSAQLFWEEYGGTNFDVSLAFETPTANNTITFKDKSGQVVVTEQHNPSSGLGHITDINGVIAASGNIGYCFGDTNTGIKGNSNGTINIKLDDNSAGQIEFTTDGMRLHNGANQIIYEGATADSNETILTATDPTSDNTITLPDASGTVLLNMVEDTTPQLGGNLDANGHDIRLDNTDKLQWGQNMSATQIKGNSSTTHESSYIQFLLRSGSNTSEGALYIQSTGLFMPTGTDIRLQGPSQSTYETVLAPTNPTANRTITIPDVTGTLITTGNLSDINNLGVFTNGITFEGSTDDGFETTLNVIDPTADRTVNLPDASGEVVVAASSTNSVTLTSTDSTNGPFINLVHDKSSPVGIEEVGAIRVFANEAQGGTQQDSAKITFGTDTSLQGQHAGIIRFATGKYNASGLTEAMSMSDLQGVVIKKPITLDTSVDIKFEGSTSDQFETTLTVVDPTQDNTVSLPDATGTLLINTGDTSVAYDTDVHAYFGRAAIGHNGSVQSDFVQFGHIDNFNVNTTAGMTVYPTGHTSIIGYDKVIINTNSAAGFGGAQVAVFDENFGMEIANSYNNGNGIRFDGGFVTGTGFVHTDLTINGTQSADRTIYLPDASGTLATIDSAQDFTAEQTFSGGAIYTKNVKPAGPRQTDSAGNTVNSGTLDVDARQASIYHLAFSAGNGTINITNIEDGQGFTIGIFVNSTTVSWSTDQTQSNGTTCLIKYVTSAGGAGTTQPNWLVNATQNYWEVWRALSTIYIAHIGAS